MGRRGSDLNLALLTQKEIHMNAYEIRHAILNEARDLLSQSWAARVDTERDAAHLENRAPVFISPPTTDEIKRTAEELYEFVCRK